MIIMKDEMDKLNGIVENLNSREKLNLLHMLQSDYVQEDVRGMLIDEGDTLTNKQFETLVENVTRRYTFECDYDCNLCYWDNLQNLIDDELMVMKGEKAI